MRLVRFVLPAVLAAAVPGAAVAQPNPTAEIRPFSKEVTLGPQTANKVRNMMLARLRITGPDYEANKAALDEFAQHIVFKITQEKYYAPPPETGELRPRAYDNTLDAVFTELDRFLLKPTLETYKTMTVDNADYVKEFGAALDRAVVTVLKSNPPAVVRTNAARMLAHAAETGSAAHAATITALLNDKNTPPEVLLYAYKAAEGLLGAANILAYKTPDPTRHTVDVDKLVPLIAALEQHVIPGPPVADKVAGAPAPAAAADGAAPPPGAGRLDASSLTEDQVNVVRYFRRAAVRALAKVRYDVLGGRNGVPEIRPAVTLARVAVNDTAVNPPATPSEQGEAVIGLCRMNLSPTMNVDELCQAIATGVVGFGRPKNADAGDKSLPWKVYGTRLTEAFADFRASTKSNPRAARSQAPINALSQIVQTEVLSRLEAQTGAVGAAPNTERLLEWQRMNPPKDANRQLFEDAPKSKLSPRVGA